MKIRGFLHCKCKRFKAIQATLNWKLESNQLLAIAKLQSAEACMWIGLNFPNGEQGFGMQLIQTANSNLYTEKIDVLNYVPTNKIKSFFLWLTKIKGTKEFLSPLCFSLQIPYFPSTEFSRLNMFMSLDRKWVGQYSRSFSFTKKAL